MNVAPTRGVRGLSRTYFRFCRTLQTRANVGYHRANATAEVQTPAIDALVATGVELNRMYAYSFCAPSRASLMSGQLRPNLRYISPIRPSENAQPHCSTAQHLRGPYKEIQIAQLPPVGIALTV